MSDDTTTTTDETVEITAGMTKAEANALYFPLLAMQMEVIAKVGAFCALVIRADTPLFDLNPPELAYSVTAIAQMVEMDTNVVAKLNAAMEFEFRQRVANDLEGPARIEAKLAQVAEATVRRIRKNQNLVDEIIARLESAARSAGSDVRATHSALLEAVDISAFPAETLSILDSHNEGATLSSTMSRLAFAKMIENLQQGLPGLNDLGSFIGSGE